MKRQLPLLMGNVHGSRSAMTCQYRCGDACFHDVPNQSGNEYIGDVISRRSLLKAGGAAAFVVSTGTLAAGTVGAGQAAAHGGPPHGGSGDDDDGALTFPPVPPNRIDNVITPAGYDDTVVVRWGDPVVPGAPSFDFGNLTEAAQLKQFGYNCDFVALLPLSGDRGLLVVNHEYTDEELMFRGYAGGATADPDWIRIAMAAHGVSVVELERVGKLGQWRLRKPEHGRHGTKYNRRFHVGTRYKFTGPAAGSTLLRTNADPSGRTVFGTLNNCAAGQTPWGTILTCEENFNQYFVMGDGPVPPEVLPALARYGFDLSAPFPAVSRRWDRLDPRFDISKEPNEPNRFGWVAEIDPFDPDSTPAKRTALGRTKHEAATVALSKSGRPVVYMGDDERFDYVYKFVSDRKMDKGSSRRAHDWNLSLLDHGTLYVAKFTGDSPASEIDGSGTLPGDGEFDGTGQWIPLVSGNTSHVPGMTVAEVLVHNRLAGDAVGATKMDRPEDMERNPVNGRVYLALTNNSNRGVGSNPGVDEANPLNRSIVAGGAGQTGNRNGHIIEIEESGNDPAATTFAWRIFMICGDPAAPETYFAGFEGEVSPISAPDNVAFDKAGNLWIATDGNVLGSNDGLFAVPVTGEKRGELKQFLTVPFGAETCGPAISWDQKTVFVAVQHPGEIAGSTPDNPSSHWPDGDQPRPSVVAVWRRDGRRVGI